MMCISANVTGDSKYVYTLKDIGERVRQFAKPPLLSLVWPL
jgi:hypothetical protein